MRAEVLAEELAQHVKSRGVDTIVGVYLALLHLRFLVKDYNTDLDRESLESLILPSVFSRVFRDSAGKVYKESLDILADFFGKHSELSDASLRSRFIEYFEVKLGDVLYVALPLYVRIEEVPEAWKDVLLRIVENVHRRLYPVQDQTQAGTVAVWEGDIARDLSSLYDLRLVEKYLLVSNIALLGYNVYLVFPVYTTSKYALSLLKSGKIAKAKELIHEIPDLASAVSRLGQILKMLIPEAKITLEDNIIRIDMVRETSHIRFKICSIDTMKQRLERDSITIILARSKTDCITDSNTLCVSTEDGVEKALLKIVAFIKNVYNELSRL